MTPETPEGRRRRRPSGTCRSGVALVDCCPRSAALAVRSRAHRGIRRRVVPRSRRAVERRAVQRRRASGAHSLCSQLVRALGGVGVRRQAESCHEEVAVQLPEAAATSGLCRSRRHCPPGRPVVRSVVHTGERAPSRSRGARHRDGLERAVCESTRSVPSSSGSTVSPSPGRQFLASESAQPNAVGEVTGPKPADGEAGVALGSRCRPSGPASPLAPVGPVGAGVPYPFWPFSALRAEDERSEGEMAPFLIWLDDVIR